MDILYKRRVAQFTIDALVNTYLIHEKDEFEAVVEEMRLLFTRQFEHYDEPEKLL